MKQVTPNNYELLMNNLEKTIVAVVLPSIAGKVTIAKLKRIAYNGGKVVCFDPDQYLAGHSNFYRKNGRMMTTQETLAKWPELAWTVWDIC